MLRLDTLAVVNAALLIVSARAHNLTAEECSVFLKLNLSANDTLSNSSCEQEFSTCVDGLQVAKLLLWDLPGFNLPCSATDIASNFVLMCLYVRACLRAVVVLM
jgi:hypothetical protein